MRVVSGRNEQNFGSRNNGKNSCAAFDSVKSRLRLGRSKSLRRMFYGRIGFLFDANASTSFGADFYLSFSRFFAMGNVLFCVF